MAEKRKFYGMKNDYMFHAVLQKNEEVLRNLLATLLEMDEADIVSCHIENPIELGKKIEGKDCILDVKIKLMMQGSSILNYRCISRHTGQIDHYYTGREPMTVSRVGKIMVCCSLHIILVF